VFPDFDGYIARFAAARLEKLVMVDALTREAISVAKIGQK
jgi:hypothetical protein